LTGGAYSVAGFVLGSSSKIDDLRLIALYGEEKSGARRWVGLGKLGRRNAAPVQNCAKTRT
jgi:hypothetical protein